MRFFESTHLAKDKEIVALYKKCHMMKINNVTKRKFLCLKCKDLVDEKFRHKLTLRKKFGEKHDPDQDNQLLHTKVPQARENGFLRSS